MGRSPRKDKNLAPGAPAKPPGMAAAVSAEWDRLTGELEAANIQLTPAHRASLALAAQLYVDMSSTRAVVEKDGAYIEGKAGLVAHPATKRLDALQRDYIKVLTMLGLRAAVASAPVSREASLSDILNG